MMSRSLNDPARTKLTQYFGFGQDLTHLLWFDQSSRFATKDSLEKLYIKWLAAAPNANGICFCELAFLLDFETGDATSIRAAANRESLDNYSRVVRSFVKDGRSLFGSEDFQSGLMFEGQPSMFCSEIPYTPTPNASSTAAFHVDVTKTFDGLAPMRSADTSADDVWNSWVHQFAASSAPCFPSSNGLNPRVLIAIPIMTPGDPFDNIRVFTGAIFAGLDDTFLNRESLAAVIQFFYLHCVSVAAIPLQKREARDARRRHLAHLLQGQVNRIFPAVVNTPDEGTREVALCAIRRLAFGVELYDDRPLSTNDEPISINLIQCVEDARRISLERLSSRVTSRTKLLDQYFANRVDEHRTLQARLNSFIENHWKAKSDVFLECVGFERQTVEIESKYDSSFASGAIVYALTQAFFHGAIFAASQFEAHCRAVMASTSGRPANKQELVCLRVSEDGVEISNRAFLASQEFWTTNDGQSLRQLNERFAASSSTQRPVEFGFAPRNGEVWFFVRFNSIMKQREVKAEEMLE